MSYDNSTESITESFAYHWLQLLKLLLATVVSFLTVLRMLGLL